MHVPLDMRASVIDRNFDQEMADSAARERRCLRPCV